ncbi:Transcription factor MYC/MYB N-terminal [Cynara cardunculus var. scolymus]|uniref:Transcription factor MYC/MYB N-terminal n=1 Tax=Cynara cardunculus var. scolymus TaxID=59895 RepID=A0A118K4X0_CYNCS|nr:Transcription factor MYC/MYB N-terminal [Cynara cardunculus var. scolymus]
MGYLLKEALKTLCGVNQWSYAIFWKIGCQNPKLLIWEECYYEPVIYANAGNGVQARNKVHTLVTKMMKDSYINLLGEGCVSKVSNEVYTQFSADIHQTIAVIPVHPHGVVQLGSSSTIMENMGFVNDVKSLISQLGCVPGALLSENYMQNEGSLDPSPNHREPICLRDSVSTHSSGKSKLTYCTLFTSDGCNQQGHSPQASGTSGHTSFSLSRHIGHSQVASGSMLASPPIIFQSSTKSCEVQEIGASGEVVPQANLYPKNDQQTSFGSFLANCDTLRSMEQHILSDAFLGDLENDTMMSQIARKSNDVRGLAASSNPPPLSDAHFTCTHVDEPKPTFDKEKLEHELFQALTMSSEEACPKAPSRDDLFDIVGMDFRNKLFGGNHNNFVNNGVEPNPQNLTRNDSSVLELQSAAGSDLFSVYEGESDSGIYSSTASDHLLDAVVSKVHTSLAKNNGSSVPVAYSSPIWANQGVHLMQGELVGVPKSLKKTGVTSSYSYKSGISKEDVGNFSDSSSIISSQISSWKEQRHNVRKNSSGVASEYAKRADEISKSNRKRLKPGENPRPRPKDRQMIQDRVKELREIIPNGAKIVSKDGGLLLRDNFEGGATWAYEVDSQSMVCPIIVEDLNSPRQMLVEMLCEERGSFLEIADVIKGLGLTILKGVMESRNDKIWAHFTVEANRDVTRMEIFISLVSLLDCGGNANVSVHEQAATGPTGSA